MNEPKPRWSRRKEERPAEIVDAAADIFIERGYAATRTDDIARRAGVAKGTLYLYFTTKEDLFKAVVEQVLTPNLLAIEEANRVETRPFRQAMPALLLLIAERMAQGRTGSILRMVLADGRTFPDLARIWHDQVVVRVLDIVAGMVEKSQARGEVAPGDARLHAFSLMGPLVVSLLFRETFAFESPYLADPATLAIQHADSMIYGLCRQPAVQGPDAPLQPQ